MKNFTAIVGSLRKESWNQKVFDNLQRLAPTGVNIEQVDIRNIPLYNEDLDNESQGQVIEMRKKIFDSDGLIIISPENNRSVPGVTKNALDWLSTGDISFVDKPALIMGATTGTLGTANAQSDLKKILLHMGFAVIGQPEVYISLVQNKIDSAGRISDEKTEGVISNSLKALMKK